MVEKFSDYEGTQWLNKEGEYEFEILDYELKEGNAAPMAVFTAKCAEGQTTLHHSLSPKARWSYNSLIKACLGLKTREQINEFECDYETIGNKLVGKKFIGNVTCECYEKSIKKPLEDGTFEESVELKESFKVTSYHFI